jgi:hypothetical protein
MSAWRKKAIECLPNLQKEFEQPDTSIYTVFFEMLPAAVEAHKQNNTEQLHKIYDYAEWCFRQKEQELWNAAGVAFYEHLGDDPETLKVMPVWIKKDIYNDIRGLLEDLIPDEALKELDIHYFGKPLKNK